MRFHKKTLKYYGLIPTVRIERRYNPLILARNNFDPDVNYNYKDGICVGYTVHPRLYDGKPPKKAPISNAHYPSRRARQRERKRKKGLFHCEGGNYPESTLSVEDLMALLKKPDITEAPPLLPPRRPRRPPPVEVQPSTDDASMRRELVEIASTRVSMEPQPAVMQPPFADQRIIRLTPPISEFSDSRQIIPVFSPDENLGATIYLCKLVDIIASNELVSIPIPSPTYPQDKTIIDVWLPPVEGGTPTQIRKERSKLVTPLFSISRDIRSKCYFEMCYDLISRNFDAIQRYDQYILNASTWKPWTFMEL